MVITLMIKYGNAYNGNKVIVIMKYGKNNKSHILIQKHVIIKILQRI